jgi:tetratricopeptide (TPR) repeat protein
MNCRATDRARSGSGAVSRGGRVCSALSVLTLAVVSHADGVAELDDAAARAQYAFYTADARALQEVLTLIEGFESEGVPSAAKSYQLAYGHWKLAKLYAQRPATDQSSANGKSLATKAAQSCVRHANNAIGSDAAMAEVHAIKAICEDFAPVARPDAATCSRNKSLKTALSLAPTNPRVRLIEAFCAPGESNEPAALERWRAVVATFESAPPSRPGKPDWGHVEALTMLGETYLQRGDAVAARDVLERALVLAPDYREAQQLLQTAATRPR